MPRQAARKPSKAMRNAKALLHMLFGLACLGCLIQRAHESTHMDKTPAPYATSVSYKHNAGPYSY